ncbi:MAG: ribosome-associated translation inhibitor RaiA [Tissierellia bacterium]|nr:ribosome-associated translation inhibitor RaiA [Tissierellia bacterium]
MKLKYTGKNVEIGKNLKEKVEKKLSKLDKYFQDDIEGHVNLSDIKNQKIVEVTIFLPGTILRAEENTHDFMDSVDRALDALEKQIRKHKTKLQKRYSKHETIRFDGIQSLEDEKEVAEDDKPKIVRVKKFGLKPMSVEEAILQMELLGHNFFVFLEAEMDIVQVVYKRKDGNYGLIEPEF